MREREKHVDVDEASSPAINATELPVRHQLATIRVWLRICYQEAGLGQIWFPERTIMRGEA